MSSDFRRIFKCMPWEDSTLSEDKVRQFTNAHMVDASPNDNPVNAHASKPTDIPAGYTYFGQFVDHDLTFDQTALSDATRLEHGSLVNDRTPVLDLDSVYQGAAKITNHRFDFDVRVSTFRDPKDRIITFRDLPRGRDGKSSDEANISDPRNDENAIISQLHLAFMLAHNEIMNRLSGDEAARFTQARRILTWLYHWVIRHDFLPRIIREDILNLAFDPNIIAKKTANVDFDVGSTQIPAEFSVAAYRFGHSMVRDSYQTNDSGAATFNEFIRIFNNSSNDDLKGERLMTLRRVVQWDWFLEMGNSGPFPQKAMPIDTKLSKALSQLERHADPNHVNNFLATRNILRGIRVGMPKASCVFRELNVFLSLFGPGAPQAKPIKFKPEAPDFLVRESLWYYILREAEEQDDGKLGVVGSSIVAFTFARLLKNTPNSYLNLNPAWKPDDEKPSGALQDADNIDKGNWTLASIIRLSGLPVSF